MTVAGLFRVLFVDKSSHRFVEFFRYFFVSAISLVADFLLLFLLTSVAGIHYLISSVFSYMAGLIVNYLLSTYWVFAKRRVSNRAVEFSVFALVGVIGLGVNEILMWLFTDVLMLYYMLSRVFSAGIGYAWKYVVRKIILFR
ncbi:GtrA family protein [Sediminispirochaeta bajacaliforniensis]|jgi:putative flippase GtrA|uniref:GtrA family protein n=1 Tax=Sediminispirochaeta bajacaliforniensis TaxID=148 RepID=UPI0003722262|nr:GtrA family protein [Sediminispirochaeta bajacaliforniensis]